MEHSYQAKPVGRLADRIWYSFVLAFGFTGIAFLCYSCVVSREREAYELRKQLDSGARELSLTNPTICTPLTELPIVARKYGSVDAEYCEVYDNRNGRIIGEFVRDTK